MEVYTFQIILFYYVLYLISGVLTGNVSVSHTFSWPHKKAERARKAQDKKLKAQAKKLQNIKPQYPHGDFGGAYGHYNLSSENERAGMGSSPMWYDGHRSDMNFTDSFK
ncbi:hypothetical protein BC355_17595 [Vibrio cholerae]|uniref:Uncharacterized protein n=1 Tax=Vibrio cholerae TaxID=666 RepID=A0A395TF43_VIBCL|nr:hypothetical protein [Vibrio cholerae]RGP82973.1 hypothetical protein BC355_17595 [Vibrio cholerae]RGP83313.1 hypothetical protein BC353_17555 [Vibrio cholerae]